MKQNPTDEEFVAALGKMYRDMVESRDPKEYGVNRVQMQKLVTLHQFFIDLKKSMNMEDSVVEELKLDPREICGGVTARYTLIDIYGDQVQRFADAIRGCSAVGIEPIIDGDGAVCISCTVPDVFVKNTDSLHNIMQ